MKKILIALAMVTLLASCTSRDNTPSPVAPTDTPQTTETKASTYEKDLKEASGKIKSSEEFKSCMDMNVPMCIQTAGMQLAQKERSTEFCEELSTPAQKESCVFAITMINAQEKNDASLCNTLTGNYAEQCNMNIIKNQAVTTKDPKVCEAIALPTDEAIGNTSRDECMLNAINSNMESTKESCSIITNEQIQNMCETMIGSRPEIQ